MKRRKRKGERKKALDRLGPGDLLDIFRGTVCFIFFYYYFLDIGSEVFNGYNYGIKCIYIFIKFQLLLKYVVVFLPFLIKSFILFFQNRYLFICLI